MKAISYILSAVLSFFPNTQSSNGTQNEVANQQNQQIQNTIATETDTRRENSITTEIQAHIFKFLCKETPESPYIIAFYFTDTYGHRLNMNIFHFQHNVFLDDVPLEYNPGDTGISHNTCSNYCNILTNFSYSQNNIQHIEEFLKSSCCSDYFEHLLNTTNVQISVIVE